MKSIAAVHKTYGNPAEVVRPAVRETTALGAAYLAGLAIGYWEDHEELRQNHDYAKRFMPQMSEEDRARNLAGWHDAVARAHEDVERSS